MGKNKGANSAKIMGRQFWQSMAGNDNSYVYYYNQLVELAMCMFEWKNLPNTIDERFLELSLLSDGMSVFFRDDVIGYLALQTTISGKPNLYNIPTERRAYASNGYQKSLNEKDSVIIWNNQIHTNSILAISNFAERLWDLDRTIDVNAKAQKTPILLVCDESQRLTLKNMYQQYSGNEPVIYGNRGLNVKDVQALSTGAPYVGDKLYELKTQIWNEALTYLGIGNVSFQKKERLIQDEVARNMGGTIANRYSRLNARRQACDEINRMFGLNISVDFRENYNDRLIEEANTDEDGGNDE